MAGIVQFMNPTAESLTEEEAKRGQELDMVPDLLLLMGRRHPLEQVMTECQHHQQRMDHPGVASRLCRRQGNPIIGDNG